jgi:hypothetical protein
MKTMGPVQIMPGSPEQLPDQPYSQAIGMIEVFKAPDAVVLVRVAAPQQIVFSIPISADPESEGADFAPQEHR